MQRVGCSVKPFMWTSRVALSLLDSPQPLRHQTASARDVRSQSPSLLLDLRLGQQSSTNVE